MATVTFNGPSKTITIGFDAPTTTIDAVDIYSAWKDWVAAGNAQYLPAFLESVGGNPIGGGVFLGKYIFVNNQSGWRVVPANVDHTLLITGEIYPGDSSLPFVSSPASANVMVIFQRSALSTGVDTGGSSGGGGSGPSADEIADEVESRVVPHIYGAALSGE